MMKYAITLAVLITGAAWLFTPPYKRYPPDPEIPCRSLSMREFRGLRELQLAHLDLEISVAAENANDPALATYERELQQERIERLRDRWHMWDELEPMRECTHRRFQVHGF